jgi:hypothetical protein
MCKYYHSVGLLKLCYDYELPLKVEPSMLDPGAQSLTDEFPTIASEELQEARRT